MRRGWRLFLIAVGVVVAVFLVALSAPVSARNAEYCHGKGGMYVYKSMQCITSDGIENLWGKQFDN